MLTFFLLFVLLQPYTRKEAKHISKEEANHHHFKGRREYYSTPFARTRIIMSFNFGNDGATQFQGGGYGCVNCLLSFSLSLRRVYEREMTREFLETFLNTFLNKMRPDFYA